MAERSNNSEQISGGEYTIDPLLEVYQAKRVVHHFTIRKNTIANGVVEWTLLEKVESMLSNVGLGKVF